MSLYFKLNDTEYFNANAIDVHINTTLETSYE